MGIIPIDNPRRKHLLYLIRLHESIAIQQLTQLYEQSFSTLQRDLQALEREGYIQRTYGMVYAVADSEPDALHSTASYQARKIEHLVEKQSIGLAARTLVKDNDVIYLSHGTTTMQLAKQLDLDQHLTIITDGIDIISSLSGKSNVRVMCVGGSVNYQSNQIEPNSHLMTAVLNANINKLIIGAGGISKEKGITFYDMISFSFINQIMDQVEEIVVLADHSKFGKVTMANFIQLEKIQHIVTDWNVDSSYIQDLEALQIQCLIASKPVL